ncbi:hypothetical protein N7501_009724 [Penicillium viridicatum]|nr:hypothetical protein N7501_009724 [Penicillium viridicatum]
MASISFSGKNHGLQVGDNRGSISAEIHLPPARPETPPNPLSTVPFARDRDFVSRDILLGRIREKCSIPGSRIALVGLGGVGKSKLAIEYSYQVQSESPATWVFWVHASSKARFEQSIRDIADQVKIPGRQDSKANIPKLVENWLRDEKKGKWICILDNADDDKFLCSLPATGKRASTREPLNASTKPLLEYVPRSRNGSMIITSRSKEVALKMVTHKDLIEVNPMERFEALELLQKTLDQPEESQESQQLVEELEFIPLAIVQAASYIRNRAPLSSVTQYLTGFRRSDREAINLLKKEVGYLGRDWEASNSIPMTWQISFDYIRYEKPSAVDLLSLMSFYDRQGIPESLVRLKSKTYHTTRTEHLGDSSDDEAPGYDGRPEFEDDVTTLKNYSFISISENGTHFTMHRLVQLTTRVWITSYKETDQWMEECIRRLYEEFPTGEYENWETCRSLFPHVRSAMSHQPASPESIRQCATLLYRGAQYAWKSGEEHKEVADSIGMLAIAYGLEGRWKEAEQLELQVVETRKSKLGESHPDSLTSMNHLALIYREQGRWEEAERLELQVMEIRKVTLGADHSDTLRSMDNIAVIYRMQGRLEEAEQLELQVVETRKTKLGEEHPDTLRGLSILASIYCNLGRWEEAEQLETIGNLASTYQHQGRWEEARQFETQVLERSKMKLGEDHPNTLKSMDRLASTYWNQGQWEEAEQLDVQVLERSRTELGEDHPDTLESMGNLALTYLYRGRREDAEHLQAQVLETSKTKLGEDHPSTLRHMSNMASMYQRQGRWEEATQLQMQVNAKSKMKLGDNHPALSTP